MSVDRAIRVFVSSTFLDMQQERDELVKRVFPRLRKLCEERGVTLTEVDLRWGITDEQSAEGQVLPICLAEIERCRPYFISLLGERYGWIPNEFSPQLVSEYRWLAEQHGRSVTELEILHGVLNDSSMANRAFFYLRDPAYINQVAAERTDDYVETDPDRCAKLAALKNRIRATKVASYDNYSCPQTFGDLLLKDLTRAINKDFPPESKPNPLARQAAEHEAFARSRTSVYIGRQEYFEVLDNHAAGTGEPLVLLGESGSGKSALLAYWAHRYQQSQPTEQVLLHFVGATADSTDWAAMLRRILKEIQQRFQIEVEFPDPSGPLRAAFANGLQMAGANGRLILVIDALNQLEDRDGAPDLVWLPPVIPKNVRLILSTLDGRPREDLKKRGWPTLDVEPLLVDERRRLIHDYLHQYAKQLSEDRIERIIGCHNTANPLFLRALLEELRVFGSFEMLDQRIDHYMTAGSIPILYERILERWEEDYQQDRTGLVRETMSLLWAARRGLSEMELMDLLGDDDRPLPRARWSPLLLAAEASLTSHGGLIGFFHDYLRQAVQNRYLPHESDRQTAHLRLAEFFADHGSKSRRVEELPWQLSRARAWRQLFDLLADVFFFEALWGTDQFYDKAYWLKTEPGEVDVLAYWSQIEAASPLRMVDAYRPVVDAPNEYGKWVCHSLARLLEMTGHLGEAIQLREHLIKYYREKGDRDNLQANLACQAMILNAGGDSNQAMDFCMEAEQICREMGNDASLQAILGNQALIQQTRGELNSAIMLYRQQEQICNQLGIKDGLQAALINQATILHGWGDLDGSMERFKQVERISHETGNKHALLTAIGNQAVLLRDCGNLNEAIKLHKQEEQICRELGYKDGLQRSLGNQARLYYDRGDLLSIQN